MPSSRPTPVRLKLLRGNPGKRRIGDVFEPPKPPAPPEPPEFLTGYAREEWERVAPGLALFRLLSNFDTMPLAAYCMAYEHWRTAEELMVRMAAGDPALQGLLVKGSKGQPRANPLLEISRMAARDMVRFADEFGFSPAARSRISAGISLVPAPKSKLEDSWAATNRRSTAPDLA
jgi:P27 family predicted phage terminase small subunit